MNDIERLISHLGRGRENAKKRWQLCEDMQMNDRQMRRVIELAQRDGYPVINFQDGAGYALAKDDEELIRYQRQEFARAHAIIKKAMNMEVCYGRLC